MSAPIDFIELFTALGHRISSETTTDGALGAVTAVAVDVIPKVAYASITRGRGSRFQTLGATHPDAEANDRTQYELDSGPCIDAVLHDETLFRVPDLATDARYPKFGPVAAATGAASMLSVRMVFDDNEIRASLNLYSREVDAFDRVAENTALVMATHAALAVSGVLARERAANLEQALTNSRTIGMALGIVMSSRRLTSDDAFTLLRIASQVRNRKLAEIAADVVLTGVLEIPERSDRNADRTAAGKHKEVRE